MSKYSCKKITSFIFLTGFMVISGCDSNRITENGFLEGKISIGPICPVERIPPDPACLPTAETYKAFPVSVFTSDGKKKIAQLNPSLDGSYSIDLPQDKYLIVLEKAQSTVGGSNLPAEVIIRTKEITQLSINIDTGIR
jgi:hypothetical protein